MNGFIGFFPDDLLDIPPEQEIDFGTELVLNTQPFFILPCRMAPTELKEQLKDLLEQGFTYPSISPWGAPVFFQKEDESLRM